MFRVLLCSLVEGVMTTMMNIVHTVQILKQRNSNHLTTIMAHSSLLILIMDIHHKMYILSKKTPMLMN